MARERILVLKLGKVSVDAAEQAVRLTPHTRITIKDGSGHTLTGQLESLEVEEWTRPRRGGGPD